MGIPGFNLYILKNAKDLIIEKHLETLQGQSIAVDISIYMHKFIKRDYYYSLFMLLFKFWYYNIDGHFVFDGKAPIEKIPELNKRHEAYIKAKIQYKEIMRTNGITNENKQLVKHLKLKSERLWPDQIEFAKNLILSFGMTIHQAEFEADDICAALFKNGTVSAVLSDDMDMCIHGVTRVLRGLTLHNLQFYEYNFSLLLPKLNITIEQLKIVKTLIKENPTIEITHAIQTSIETTTNDTTNEVTTTPPTNSFETQKNTFDIINIKSLLIKHKIIILPNLLTH